MLNEDLVRAALRNVYDPEIGLNIVDLGLVYGVDISEDGKQARVEMTLTTPACPAGPMILENVQKEVMSLRDVHPQLEEAKVNLVWTPFWNPSMMSEDAREELGYF